MAFVLRPNGYSLFIDDLNIGKSGAHIVYKHDKISNSLICSSSATVTPVAMASSNFSPYYYGNVYKYSNQKDLTSGLRFTLTNTNSLGFDTSKYIIYNIIGYSY